VITKQKPKPSFVLTHSSQDGSSGGLRKAVEGVHEGLQAASTAVYETRPEG